MLELYLPYLIALSLGLDMPTEGRAPDTGNATNLITEQSAEGGANAVAAAVANATAEVSATAAETTATTAGTNAAREPEPQVATGQFTTALEVAPIVAMTKLNWVAISNDGSNDLLYFSNLLAWRCGMWEIRYGINGAPATNVLEMEPCHTNTASPNAMTDVINYPIWVTLPGESIQSVRVEVTFDDGSEDFAEMQRTQILLP